MSNDFETDEHGNIKTQPVMGWTTSTLANMFVLLAMQYLDRSDGIGIEKSVQLLLTPPQCLELAETLKRQAGRTLDPSVPPVGGVQ
jgi:hypothetical protein